MIFPLVLALLAAGMLAFGLSGPSPKRAADKRLGRIRARHSSETGDAQLRRIIAQKADTSLDDLIHQMLPNPALLRKRLERTGRSWTLGQYAMACAGLAAAMALTLLVTGQGLLLSVVAGLAVGLGIPHMIVGRMATKRVTKFTTRFPDAIELLVRGLRSGLPIGETMAVVASEVSGPVGVEFRGVVDRMKIGKTMDQSLQEAADRLGTAEFQFFVIALAIQRETGGNLAETLSNLADVLRKRGQMKLKVKAMASESKASAWIIGLLPFIVFGLITFVNPTYMSGFLTDPRLQFVGMGGLLWMALGVFVMSKMMNFEI
ncbi:MAG: type II secretion system F family protein [Sphingomonas fennica]